MMTVTQTLKPVTYYDPEARRYRTRYEPGISVQFETTESEAEDNESEICSSCNGSGEGMYDGTRCSCCGGSGVEREEDDRRDYEREDKE